MFAKVSVEGFREASPWPRLIFTIYSWSISAWANAWGKCSIFRITWWKIFYDMISRSAYNPMNADRTDLETREIYHYIYIMKSRSNDWLQKIGCGKNRTFKLRIEFKRICNWSVNFREDWESSSSSLVFVLVCWPYSKIWTFSKTVRLIYCAVHLLSCVITHTEAESKVFLREGIIR